MPSDSLLADNIRRAATAHKKQCNDEDCDVSLYLLGEAYAKLIGRKLTDEELGEFL